MPTIISTSSIAAAALVPASIMAAAAGGSPYSGEGWCVVGATFASVISVYNARKTDRSVGHMASVLVSTVFCGAVLPSAFLYYKFPVDTPMYPPAIWLASGFFVALMGWALVVSFLSVIPNLIQRWIRKIVNDDLEKEKDEK